MKAIFFDIASLFPDPQIFIKIWELVHHGKTYFRANFCGTPAFITCLNRQFPRSLYFYIVGAGKHIFKDFKKDFATRQHSRPIMQGLLVHLLLIYSTPGPSGRGQQQKRMINYIFPMLAYDKYIAREALFFIIQLKNYTYYLTLQFTP